MGKSAMLPKIYDLTAKRIFVAGHRGMVGSSLVHRLSAEACQILTADKAILDLRQQDRVEKWFEDNRPDVVVLAAGLVGGIQANAARPVDFLLDNLQIGTNVIAASHRHGVKKLLFLGSSCIYPRLAEQPIRESELLKGPLEPTNQWYAIAKIAGLKLVQAFREQFGADFISAMPTNLYGPRDNFDLGSAHVLPALLRRAHEALSEGADELVVWGSGAPLREMLYVDDLADACVFLLERYSGTDIVNVGSGQEYSIAEIAHKIAAVVGYQGAITFDAGMPDGTPRKLLDTSLLASFGWKARWSFDNGVAETYAWFRTNLGGLRR